MSFQRFNNNNILSNHSQKLIEFQKNLDDVQKLNTKLESKIQNLVNNFNKTIDGINNMFVNKQFNVVTRIKYNFDKSLLPKKLVSSNFGQSITQTSYNIIIGDPKTHNTGCVYIYHKDQYKHYKEFQQINPHNNTYDFGQSVSIYNSILVITGLSKNCGYVYIYYKNSEDKWEKYQIIEVFCEEVIQKSSIKIINQTIMVSFNNKFTIIEKNDDRAWEKIQNINNVTYFSLFNKTLVLIIEDEVIIYEKDSIWAETQKISLKQSVNNIYLHCDQLLIGYDKNIELFQKDNLHNWTKRQSFNIQSFDFAMNDDTLIIAGMLGNINPIMVFEDEIYNSILYIYKKYGTEWQLLRKMVMCNMKMGLKLKLNINHQNNIIFSNYYHNSDYNGDVYIIKELENNKKWMGTYASYMNRLEIQITGEYFSDNATPYFHIFWPDLKLPKIRSNFYYKNIPNISIKIYDLEDNSYRNDLKIMNITFNDTELKFYVKNIDILPYNYIFYISINYIIN